MGSESQTSQLGGAQRAGMPPLPRQSSIYSLTLDQFQNTMVEPGKSFGSMNMDEFLKNIWTAEENQAMAAALGGGIHDVAAPGGISGLARQPSWQLQGSLGSLTLPRTLSKKTVDEVWKDIDKEPGGSLNAGGKSDSAVKQPRQLTYGEMTLEDFLLKAGVVREELEPTSQSFIPYIGGVGNQGGIATTLPQSPVNVLTNEKVVDTTTMQLDAYKTVGPIPGEWLNHSYQNPTIAAMAKQQNRQADASSYLNTSKRIANGATSAAAGIGAMNVGSSLAALGGMGLVGGIGLASGLTEGLGPGRFGLGASPGSDGMGPSDFGFSPAGSYGMNGGFRGRKRGAEGPVEKVVERRQRRMIKNRESAARSRARKQAYTVELESEVTQLKEENMRLRKQQEEDAERRNKQMLDMMASLAQEKRSKTKVLRRTQSGPW
ncbi:hypothetical protein O6H91_01G017300 [Diphasiastrum complanatum]|uniref:Uncharacterized protein n=2 Tax=Diphasiastrum complanatum TaxID=34168 RepID=A0ACC2ENJ9_DIPCM|nr:hypothetical protein O6H91_01G017300 [Diphasiastrum complanatum]KAJ7568062.1 hypothetical protein O6H91_01G017300 [Diphasiastrum complanatum]